jgi:hypothetical protein
MRRARETRAAVTEKRLLTYQSGRVTCSYEGDFRERRKRGDEIDVERYKQMRYCRVRRSMWSGKSTEEGMEGLSVVVEGNDMRGGTRERREGVADGTGVRDRKYGRAGETGKNIDTKEEARWREVSGEKLRETENVE